MMVLISCQSDPGQSLLVPCLKSWLTSSFPRQVLLPLSGVRVGEVGWCHLAQKGMAVSLILNKKLQQPMRGLKNKFVFPKKFGACHHHH